MNEDLAPWDGPPPPPAGPPQYPYASWPPPLPPTSAPPRTGLSLRRSGATVAALVALVGGSAAAGFLITHAATGTPAAANAAASSGSGTTPSPSPTSGPRGRGRIPGLLGLGPTKLLQDAASAIGISEQTLRTDLQGGKSVAQVATANGKTAQDVINALVTDETSTIDGLVSSGKLTSSQATTLKSHLTQMVTTFVNRTRPAGRSSGVGDQAALEAAAKAIGISASQLSSDLVASQTIASVAQAHNVSASAVISAVTTEVDSQIASLQTSGKITSAQASQLTAQVQQRVTDWVDSTYPGWPFGPFNAAPHHGGPAFGGGPGLPTAPIAAPSPSAS